MHLRAGRFHGRRFARVDLPLGNTQATLGQLQGLLRQLQALLCGERAIEGGDHIGSQPVAFALKVHIDRILRAAGDFDSGAAFAAQFQGLAEHHRGGAGFAPGVLGFPGQFRVGDQPGLLAFTLGDTHVPLRGRQLRVVGEGAVEGLVQGQRRSLRDGRQRSTEEHRGDEQDTGKGY
ncbi:hypothetical protein D3C85_1076060 [compost metagenome]